MLGTSQMPSTDFRFAPNTVTNEADCIAAILREYYGDRPVIESRAVSSCGETREYETLEILR